MRRSIKKLFGIMRVTNAADTGPKQNICPIVYYHSLMLRLHLLLLKIIGVLVFLGIFAIIMKRILTLAKIL